MADFTYNLVPESGRVPTLGLVVLQSDETIENEIRHWLPPTEYSIFVSRVQNAETVTTETLAAMADHMTASAGLFPRPAKFDAVAYCCTSASSVIGTDKVAELVKAGCTTNAVTNPVTALIAACNKRGLQKLAFLSPYIESVNNRLRAVIAENGIETPVFGSFNESEDHKVAWIDHASLRSAATELAKIGDVDGVFMSCTSLKTFGLLDELEQELNMPVLSSNFVVAEHLRDLATN
ncbi:MAG: Asp/Glu racemase [Pseudomonadota bacterium]